ncbi:MAG: hypothetical protein HY898_30460 [Deltaproteobacteria bacterium]|nr:hypothetical protein [Deltaproteobacteria bacterium]
MSPRIIYLAILTSLVAASSCAFEASTPTDDEVGTQKSTLTAGGGGEVKQVDTSGGSGEATPPGNPGPGDPASTEQSAGDPGKPSPDPWIRPSKNANGSPVIPESVDPSVKSTTK